MKHLFYTTSQSAWNGLTTAIKKAEHSIYFEMYIFLDDTYEGKEILEILCEKARNGVRVRMILDAFGSYDLSKEALVRLRSAGAEILFFKKLFRRLHRKIVIIDEQVAFLGGVNIHGLARSWSDLLLRVEGPIVRSIIWSFRTIYKACGGVDLHILGYKGKPLFANTRIWLLEHVPFIRKPKLRDSYMETIIKAEHDVVIVTPYFLPHRWFIKLIRSIVSRGVRVTVIVPRSTDSAFLDRANRRYMTLLYEHGVTFLLTNTMNHAKLLWVDGIRALVGSQNIDALSFDFNAEASLVFEDQKMLASLGKIIDQWKKQSVQFSPQLHITTADKIFSFFVRFLQPFL